MIRWVSTLFVLATISSCIEDRLFPVKQVEIPKSESGKYGINSVLINEFIASACKSSEVSNGSCKDIISTFYTPTESRNGKWIEIYNPGDTAILLGSGQWYLTDDTLEKSKFLIPDGTKVGAKDYLLICCDNSPGFLADRQIHTNFSLSRYAGDVAIYYKTKVDADSVYLKVNEIQYVSASPQIPAYDSTARHISYGRQPDGNGGPLNRLSKATPGKPNTL